MTTLSIINKARRVCEVYQSHTTNYFIFPCLGEMCAVASAFLMNKLRDHRRKASMIMGTFKNGGHCWVEYNNKIYDITATQFHKPKIHIVKSNNKLYNKKVIIDGMDKYIIKKEFADWESYQRPTRRILKKLDIIWKSI